MGLLGILVTIWVIHSRYVYMCFNPPHVCVCTYLSKCVYATFSAEEAEMGVATAAPRSNSRHWIETSLWQYGAGQQHSSKTAAAQQQHRSSSSTAAEQQRNRGIGEQGNRGLRIRSRETRSRGAGWEGSREAGRRGVGYW
jgi:hypothetical protein